MRMSPGSSSCRRWQLHRLRSSESRRAVRRLLHSGERLSVGATQCRGGRFVGGSSSTYVYLRSAAWSALYGSCALPSGWAPPAAARIKSTLPGPPAQHSLPSCGCRPQPEPRSVLRRRRADGWRPIRPPVTRSSKSSARASAEATRLTDPTRSRVEREVSSRGPDRGRRLADSSGASATTSRRSTTSTEWNAAESARRRIRSCPARFREKRP